jgi:hypothetical protein
MREEMVRPLSLLKGAIRAFSANKMEMKMQLKIITLLAVPVFAAIAAQADATGTVGSRGVVGREVAAPSWSAACMTDHGPSQCDEPMWVYGSPAAVSRYKDAF